MRYALTATALVLLSLTVIALAQNQPLTFEVASVKASPPATGFAVSFGHCHSIDKQLPVYPPGVPITLPALGRFLIRRFTLVRMISFAYPGTAAELPGMRVTGGPAWAASPSDWFDVDGKAENANSAKNAELLAMLRQLLADRFKLKIHTVPKEFNGFALTIGKNGHKLAPGADEPPSLLARQGHVSVKNTPMTGLAEFLSSTLIVPVVDRTGLKGVYTFSFSLPASDDPSEHNPSAASVISVLQKELGLRLESTKVPVDIIVIDHAEKPDAN